MYGRLDPLEPARGRFTFSRRMVEWGDRFLVFKDVDHSVEIGFWGSKEPFLCIQSGLLRVAVRPVGGPCGKRAREVVVCQPFLRP